MESQNTDCCNKDQRHFKKGQIWFLGEFTLGDNNEIGNHPVIIVSNDDINNTSSSVTVVPMTSKSKPPMKTNVIFRQGEILSTAVTNNVFSVPKTCLLSKKGTVPNWVMRNIENSLIFCFDLTTRSLKKRTVWKPN